MCALTTVQFDKAAIEAAAGVDTFYGLLAVALLILATLALYLFRKDSVNARVVIFFSLLALAGIFAWLAKPLDSQAAERERRAAAALDDLRRAHETADLTCQETIASLQQALAALRAGHAESSKSIENAKAVSEEASNAEVELKAAKQRLAEEARMNIVWSILEDRGARERYDSARRRGMSKFDAVLISQAHNPHSQATIRQLGEAEVTKIIEQCGG